MVCLGVGRGRASSTWRSPHWLPSLSQLTPASHDDLSDFRSEPALYF